MNFRIFLPNLFTAVNILCGLFGVIFSFQAAMHWSAICILIAAVADFLDGFVARAVNGQSEFGKQFDSLADAITFGVLPGVLLFHFISAAQGQYFTTLSQRPLMHLALASIGLLVSVFSAIRLGIFNIDTRQSDQFLGLPTPANAILVSSFALVMHYQLKLDFYSPFSAVAHDSGASSLMAHHFLAPIFSIPTFWIGLSLFSCIALVIRVPLIALKFKHFKWQGNQSKFVLMGVAFLQLFLGVLFPVSFGLLALPVLIITYMTLSVLWPK